MSRTAESAFPFTTLPPAVLRTSGPGLQESLHHYAMRVAEQCNLGLGQLQRFLLRDSSSKSEAAVFPSSWIGPRSNFRFLLTSLQRDTGRTDLAAGTFLAVSEVMGRGGTRRRQGRGEGRAWCPVCYLEWDYRESSEPLLWAFDMLSACPVHDTLLETRCIGCNCPQAFSVPISRRRRCQVCGEPLGHAGALRELSRQQQWVNATLRDFTEWIGTQVGPVSPKHYGEFVGAIAVHEWVNRKVSSWMGGLVRTTVSSNGRRVSLPTATTLLSLAAVQGTSVQAILSNADVASAEKLFSDQERFEEILFKRRDLQLNHRRIAYVLDRLSRSRRPVPPPSTVWLSLDLWCDAGRDTCPREQALFRERYGAQSAHLRSQRFKAGVEICANLIEQHGPWAWSLVSSILERRRYAMPTARCCFEAAMALRCAVRLSGVPRALLTFENERIGRAEAWMMNVDG